MSENPNSDDPSEVSYGRLFCFTPFSSALSNVGNSIGNIDLEGFNLDASFMEDLIPFKSQACRNSYAVLYKRRQIWACREEGKL